MCVLGGDALCPGYSVLGGDTPSVRGTLGVKVCPGGRYALRPGYSREICPLSGVL